MDVEASKHLPTQQGPIQSDPMLAAMQKAFGAIALASQNEESIRRSIYIGHYEYAMQLMKAWYKREPESIEALRRLKAYMIERRAERRVVFARYARNWRAKKRAQRISSDLRTCAVCSGSMAGKRAEAVTCSTKCRMARSRAAARLPF
jgi:hypothetical protein